MNKIIFTLAILLVATNANAAGVDISKMSNSQLSSASTLLALCESADHADRFFCTGYFLGQLHSINWFNTALKMDGERNGTSSDQLKKTTTCIPHGVTAGQMEKVFMKYARDHPGKLHKDMSSIVWLALLEIWRCSYTPIPENK